MAAVEVVLSSTGELIRGLFWGGSWGSCIVGGGGRVGATRAIFGEVTGGAAGGDAGAGLKGEAIVGGGEALLARGRILKPLKLPSKLSWIEE